MRRHQIGAAAAAAIAAASRNKKAQPRWWVSKHVVETSGQMEKMKNQEHTRKDAIRECASLRGRETVWDV